MDIRSIICNSTTIELDIQDFMYISMISGIGYFIFCYIVIKQIYKNCYQRRYNVPQAVIGEYV